jgi:hypothetical protein
LFSWYLEEPASESSRRLFEGHVRFLEDDDGSTLLVLIAFKRTLRDGIRSRDYRCTRLSPSSIYPSCNSLLVDAPDGTHRIAIQYVDTVVAPKQGPLFKEVTIINSSTATAFFAQGLYQGQWSRRAIFVTHTLSVVVARKIFVRKIDPKASAPTLN